MNKNKKVIVTLAGLVITTIHIINRVEYSLCISKDILSDCNEQYYKWRFGNIRYTVQGSGSPVLLVHDLTPGASSYEFSAIRSALSKTNTVYCVDLLGYGLSDKPNMTYTNYLFVQQISDFIKNIIGARTTIIASGNSTTCTIMAAYNDSEYINHLILLHPQDLYEGNKIPSNTGRLLKMLIDTPVIGTFIYNLHTNHSAFETLFRYEYLHAPIDEMNTVIDAYVESAHANHCKGKYAYSSFISKYSNTNIIAALKEINNNILILSGENAVDTDVNEGNYKYFNKAIETERIKNAKEMPHLENVEYTIKAITNYIYSMS